MIEKVTENMKGWFYCNVGYLKKSKDLIGFAESCRFIGAVTRQNMNRPI